MFAKRKMFVMEIKIKVQQINNNIGVKLKDTTIVNPANGTIEITSNGTHNIKNYEFANVFVSEKKPQQKNVEYNENGNYEVVPNEDSVLTNVSIKVNVPIPQGYIKPSGSLDITSNGEHNINEFEKVNVNIPQEIDEFLTGEMAHVYNDRVTKLMYGFCNNYNILSVDFPNVEEVGDRTFSGAAKLEIIKMPKLKKVGPYGFHGTKINADNSIFSTIETWEGSNQFFSCAAKGPVSMPKITMLPTACFASAGITAFRADNCITQGGNQAFSNCKSLEYVFFDKLTEVGTQWFNGCLALKKAEFNSVTRFRGYAFQGCSKLETLIIRTPNVVATTDANMFHSFTFSGNIYVLDNLVESYKVATNWSVYADKIKGLSEYVEA